jgi:protein involved in polysaccharide export with SLBB domain
MGRRRHRTLLAAALAGLTLTGCYQTSRPADERAEEIDLSSLKHFEPSEPNESHAVATPPIAAPTPPASVKLLVEPLPQPTPAAGQIAIGDVLEVTVKDHPKVNGSFRVDEGGNVSIPVVGPVKAAGRSVWSVKGEITERLRARVDDPEVHVVRVPR